MKLREWAAFLSLTFIWGASFLWIKIAVAEIDPFSLVAFRLALGLVGLIVFFTLRKPAIPRDFRVWVSLAVLGIFAVLSFLSVNALLAFMGKGLNMFG